MSEAPEAYARYAHYKANVGRRRRTYKIFIPVVIAVFLLSVADILWFDEVLQWAIYGAYAILFVWAIVLLFAATIRNAWDVGEVILNCPSCKHSFLYAADHADNKGHAQMTCPICAHVAPLPDEDTPATPSERLDGQRYDTAYACEHCEEHFVITTIGARPKGVQFDHCPHCGEEGTVGRAELPDEVDRHRLPRWSAA